MTGTAIPAGVHPPTIDSAGDNLFGDGKDAGALRTIGEVARALGLRQHVLRYWESQFPTLRPLTRAGGRRYYRPEHIALLIEIDRLLHREGFTIRGARQAMAAAIPAPDTSASLPGAGDDMIAVEPELALAPALSVLRQHLQAIRNRLAHELSQT